VKVCIWELKANVTVQLAPVQLSTTLAEAGSGESTPKHRATTEARERRFLEDHLFMAQK
jgi:hypothetical protein